MAEHDQYEAIADSFDHTFKQIPPREHFEAYSLHRLLGDLTGLSILDLACGTGIFTRALKRWGAARVVGVDISEDMIRVARTLEEEHPLGVEYVTGDVASLGDLGPFDCAVAIYLLGYASSRDHIVQMGRGIARNLKPGARFLTYIIDPRFSREPGYYRKYGLEIFGEENGEDGGLIHFQLYLNGTATPKIAVHNWSMDTLGAAFEEAGFTDVRWVQPELSPQGREKYGDEYWADYLRRLPGIFLEARKE